MIHVSSAVYHEDGYFYDLDEFFEYIYELYEEVNASGEEMEASDVLPKYYSTCKYKIDEGYSIYSIIEDGGNILDPIYYVYYSNKDKHEIIYPKEILELFKDYENTN